MNKIANSLWGPFIAIFIFIAFFAIIECGNDNNIKNNLCSIEGFGNFLEYDTAVLIENKTGLIEKITENDGKLVINNTISIQDISLDNAKYCVILDENNNKYYIKPSILDAMILIIKEKSRIYK